MKGDRRGSPWEEGMRRGPDCMCFADETTGGQHTRARRGWAEAARRLLDIVAAAAGLIVCSPLLLATGVAVRVTMGGPVLFRQARGGLHGQVFLLNKLRTMRNSRDSKGQLLPDEKRLTPLGQFLRVTSIDELPQLWNVLRGDMSLVGPRPLFAEYLPRYNEWERRRHEVKPGITGWAQINGRNSISWQDRFSHDLWYVENRSLRLDAKILVRTAVQLVRRTDIRAAAKTMPEFLGSERGHAS